MNKEISDPSTVDEGHHNDQSHYTIVLHLETSISAKFSTSVSATAANLLDNGATYAA